MTAPSDVEPCDFADVFEMAAEARDDGVYAKDRPEGQWYRYDDAGMICLWEPQNRSNTQRISHWWVREARRNEGIGEALLDRALTDADAETVDIYVYDSRPVEERGFEYQGSGQAQDGAEYYTLSEEQPC